MTNKISVGINENVVLEMPELIEKDTDLFITFPLSRFGEEDAEFDPFTEERDEHGYVITSGGASNVTITKFPPMEPFESKTKGGTPFTPAERAARAMDSLKEFQNLYMQILLQYTSSDKIKFDMWRDMNLDRANYQLEVVKKAVLRQAWKNLTLDFLNMIEEVKDKLPTTPLRVLLVRRNETKHYADFRKMWIADNPIFERMEIPEDQSKLAFTNYELERGLNSGKPIQQAEADDSDTSPSGGEVVDSKSIFGG